MNVRNDVFGIGFVCWGIVCWLMANLGTVACAEETRERPNIVLILADDLGYSDLGCFGSEININPKRSWTG